MDAEKIKKPRKLRAKLMLILLTPLLLAGVAEVFYPNALNMSTIFRYIGAGIICCLFFLVFVIGYTEIRWPNIINLKSIEENS